MSFNAAKLKQIDKKTKYFVYGFIRNEQKSLSSHHDDNPFYTIPELIIYQCLLYYYLNEYFNIICEGVTTLNNKQSIKNIKHRSTTCYGNIIIDPNESLIHKWEIKIDNCSHHNYICIGIDSSMLNNKDNTKKPKRAFYVFNKSYFYAYAAWKEKYATDIDMYQGDAYEGDGYGSGDTIYMTLDGQKLSFHKNEAEQAVVFENVNESVKYNLAVYTADEDDMVTIVNYTAVCKR